MKITKRPPSATAQYDFWRKELNKQLEPVSQTRANEYNQTVSGWQSSHRPQFKGQVVDRPDTVFIRVIMENGNKVLSKYGGTIRDLWKWWNEGTGIHGPRGRTYSIYPRFAKTLRFVVNGAVVFAKYVKAHPGMRGSGAKDKIDKRLDPLERRSIGRAGRIAFQRLEKHNK